MKCNLQSALVLILFLCVFYSCDNEQDEIIDQITNKPNENLKGRFDDIPFQWDESTSTKTEDQLFIADLFIGSSQTPFTSAAGYREQNIFYPNLWECMLVQHILQLDLEQVLIKK